jgi:hypothetical protein
MANGYSRWAIGFWLAVLFFIGGQAFPYGRAHTNPLVVAEPRWDSPETRRLAKAACFDCHSNETRWPMYSHLAPISWLVQHDVDAGRATLNFSEFRSAGKAAHDAVEEVREGEMPPPLYRLMHPDALLNPSDRERLAQGLARTLGEPASDHDR